MSAPRRSAWLLAAALASACQPADRAGGRPAAAAQADALAAATLGEREIPGLALVVLRGDETLIARGYGRASIEADERVTDATVFQLGSITKQFVAALVVALAEDGRLTLDDAVTGHLPELTRVPPATTVRHLLNHTAGLREIFTDPEAQAAFDDPSRPRGDLPALLRRLPVDFAPGARWSYSNTNYLVLTLLVERLMSRPYEMVLADRLLRPSGLTSIRQCTPLPQQTGDARGHERREGRIVPAAPENMDWILGDGGLCGNARDVARWTRLLATGRVVSGAGYRQMIARARLGDGRVADYGFGLSRVPLDGRPKAAHNGAMRGFSASAAYYPDAALTVVVLANRGDVRTESIERRVARLFLDLPPPSLDERPLPPEVRARVPGTYDIGVFDVTIAEREGRLWLQMPPPGPTTALRYLGGGEFVGEADPEATRVTLADGAGPARELRLLMGAMHWYGWRRK